jgi:hypothetical protein
VSAEILAVFGSRVVYAITGGEGGGGELGADVNSNDPSQSEFGGVQGERTESAGIDAMNRESAQPSAEPAAAAPDPGPGPSASPSNAGPIDAGRSSAVNTNPNQSETESPSLSGHVRADTSIFGEPRAGPAGLSFGRPSAAGAKVGATVGAFGGLPGVIGGAIVGGLLGGVKSTEGQLADNGSVTGGFFGGQPPGREGPTLGGEPGRDKFHEGEPTLLAPGSGAQGGSGAGGDGGGEGGDGGAGGDFSLPGLPTLPEPPAINPPAPTPTFGAGGEATDSTKAIIDRAQKFGREGTILTGGAGLPSYGETVAPGLAGTEATALQSKVAPGPAGREGQRRPSISDVFARLDHAQAQPVTADGSAQATSEGPGTVALPEGYTVVQEFSTIPWQIVKNADGTQFLRNLATGELVLDTEAAPSDVTQAGSLLHG